MNKTLELVALDNLVFGENFRLPNLYNLTALQSDIERVGLTEPLMVWARDDGENEILRGNRRGRSIFNIFEQNPDKFGELFTEGVECIVVTDITEDEALKLKVDEGTKQPLTHPYELQLAADMLFQAGLGEHDIAVSLSDRIDQISPMKSKAKEELKALEIKLADAQKQGLTDYIAVVKHEIREFLGAYRRGFCQNLNNTYRSPEKVRHALFFHACGEKPEAAGSEYLPKLTQSQVTTLWKVHKKDMDNSASDNGGVTKFNKTVTGPLFNAKWHELCQKDKDRVSGEPTPPNPKAMSAKDIKADITDGKFKSEAVILACQYHAGDKDVAARLVAADEIAYQSGLVAANDPELWEMVVSSAAAQIEQMKAEDVEATA